MSTAITNSGIIAKKSEKASHRTKKAAKTAKHEVMFDRAAIDRALDESIDEKGNVLLYEVDMKNPKESIRKIMEHSRRAK